MAWHWPGDKPLSKPIMASLLMLIYIILPQWVIPFCLDGSLLHHGYWSTFAQVMACCLIAPSHNLHQYWLFCQLDPYKHISMEFYSKFRTFKISRKHIWNIVCKDCGHFVQTSISVLILWFKKVKYVECWIMLFDETKYKKMRDYIIHTVFNLHFDIHKFISLTILFSPFWMFMT